MLKDFKKIYNLTDKMAKGLFISMFFVGVFDGFITILFADSFKTLIDVLIQLDGELLKKCIIELIILVVFITLIEPIVIIKKAKLLEMNVQYIRVKTYKHMQELPVAYFDKHHSGDIISRMNKDVEATKDVMSRLEFFVTAIISLCFIGPYFISLDVRFAIIGFGLSIMIAFINTKFVRPMREKSREIHKETAILAETITENITGFNVIKLYLLKAIFMTRFGKKLNDLLGLKMQEISLGAKLYSLNAMMWWFTEAGLSVIGVFFVINGSMEASVLVAGTMVAGNMVGGFMRLFRTNAEIQKPMAGVTRLEELYKEKTEPTNYSITSKNYTSGVYFKDVHFEYIDNTPVINGVDIDVKTGEMVALVGNSGGGKSTIVKLILGLYEAKSGEMTINKKPLNEYTLNELRENISYVPQDAYIFNGSIYENISFGKANASKEEIEDAAKKANAHEFILSQKDKYETLVGERGIKLSGGQRQRIAIARAILKNAPILLLDEATSSLDSESELLIQDALEKLMIDKTSIVVAHRLSTIKNADNIYYIKDGVVKEQGSHDQLVEQKGLYNELYYREFEVS